MFLFGTFLIGKILLSPLVFCSYTEYNEGDGSAWEQLGDDKMKRERLIAQRIRLGLKQEDVAAAVGVTRSTYVRYETGLRMPSIPVARRIAVVLNSTVDYLFGDDVPNRKNSFDEHAALDATGTE